MAKMLADSGIQPMHSTTVAKIEAGERSVRINEAAGIADLFGVTVDSLLGRKLGKGTGLPDALGWVMDSVQIARTSMGRDAKSLRARLDEVPRFEGRSTLLTQGRLALDHIEIAIKSLNTLDDLLIRDMEMRIAAELFGKEAKK